MENTHVLFALAALGGLSYLFAKSSQAGTGAASAGTITTDTPGELNDLGNIAASVYNGVVNAAPGNPDTLSVAGLAALQQREGFAAKPYPDHKGYSIGYGHLIKPGESFTTIDQATAIQLLANDVQWAQDAVTSAINAPLTQSQFDALVSFAFNVGAGAFKKSTLVRMINDGQPGASGQFGRWVYASGAVLPALVTRRASEQQQFESYA